MKNINIDTCILINRKDTKQRQRYIFILQDQNFDRPRESLTALLQVSVQILVPIQGPHPGYRILYPSHLHYRQIARAYARVLSCATTVRLDPG